MPVEQLKTFLESAATNTSLLDQLKTADTLQAVSDLAKRTGYDVNEEDVNFLIHKLSTSPTNEPTDNGDILDDEALEGITGGGYLADGIGLMGSGVGGVIGGLIGATLGAGIGATSGGAIGKGLGTILEGVLSNTYGCNFDYK